MRTHPYRDIVTAAADGDGFCLICGSLQPVRETRLLFGPCDECFAVKVLPASYMILALDLLQPPEEDDLA